MGDVLENTVGGFKRDIAAADWATKTFMAGVPDALIPSKLLDAALKIRPDIMFSKADKVHVLHQLYQESILDQARQKYDLLQDSWAGEGAQSFGHVWQEVNAYVATLAQKASDHAVRCTQAGDTLNSLRTACANAVMEHLKGMHDAMEEYLDATQTTFSDLWNGMAGDPADIATMMTDGVTGFMTASLKAASWKLDVYQNQFTLAEAVDAVPVIDSAQFARTGDPSTAVFGDYTHDWKPEKVDGKPWDSE
ncbi:WXG100 family type VII secretion target [Dactylosporangium sp. NPDC051485]|uniref:WXG100 family type VII secretion target n=1 Tax=Dactylosporangium sp. NPDC051485 TaxID=3154846 RepID=UPI0034465EBB